MSTADLNGAAPLTRRQLRELREAGGLPPETQEVAVVAPDADAVDATAEAAGADEAVVAGAIDEPVVDEPVVDEVAVAEESIAPDEAVAESPTAPRGPFSRLSRRRVRWTEEPAAPAAVAVPVNDGADAAPDEAAASADDLTADTDQVAVVAEPIDDSTTNEKSEAEPVAEVSAEAEAEAEPVAQADAEAEPVAQADAEADEVTLEELLADSESVSDEPSLDELLAAADEPSDATPAASDEASFAAADNDDLDDSDEEVTILPKSASSASTAAVAPENDDDADVDGADVEATDADNADDADASSRATVSSDFGARVLQQERISEVPDFEPSFDDLLTATHSGDPEADPNTLIFTPADGDGMLSGPVASTGEILVTGSYELPRGIATHGHAEGMSDGKDVDSVLIDGELPAASSPTPIAASSAISTLKPAGEVIRPPAPEKGNRLMIALAITAGGLAVVLAAGLFYAFSTNVL